MIANTMTSQNERILTVEALDLNYLKAFFNNEICAIRVPDYISTELCDRLSSYFLNNDIEEYHHEVRDNKGVQYLKYGVGRVGIAFNTTYNKAPDSEEISRYYNEALPNMRKLRNSIAPFLSPIDKLRLEMDELWPYNANVAAFEGKKMFTGIGRIMFPETSYLAETQPHFDSVPDKLSTLIGQFSANIYLTIPPTGGELELWDIPPLPISEIDSADLDKNWRSTLPPSLLIKPKKAEMILINTRRAHAVRKFDEGKRITIQCFIGLKSDNSLVFWN
jgi:hypothetical protein